MRLVLGVDGGGTHTRCVLADENLRVLGVGVGGPSNYDRVGAEAAGKNLREAIRAACTSLPDLAAVEAIFLGMAGVVSESDRAVVREMVAGVGLGPLVRTEVDHDIRIALAGATGGAPGIALIAGTGSACYGRNAAGDDWRSGGWGYLLDDLGSGFYLGQQALVSITRAHDGRGPATRLLDPVLEALGVRQIDDLMHRIYHPQLDQAAIAALAPIVIGLADQDAAARAIVEAGCRELAVMVRAVADRLQFRGPVTVVALGGLAESSPRFRDLLTRAIMQAVPEARIQPPAAPPVAGAVLLALAALGAAPPPLARSELRNLRL